MERSELPPATTTSPAPSPDGTTGATGDATGPGRTDPATDLPPPLATALRQQGEPGEPEVVATDLDVPWSVVALPDGTALVSLRDEARVVWVGPDGAVTPVAATGPDGRVPGVAPSGEAGLLGLALPPDAGPGTTSLYAYTSTATDNRVLRLPLSVDRRSLGEPEVLLDGIPLARNHDGGRLAFGPDGMLYVTTGDAGDRDSAQDPGSLAGKILRLTPDGEPAPGNPDPGSPVWSLGHRNVQGVGWDAAGRMYASEFGQDTLDELNLVTPGGNYGWPDVEGTVGAGDDRFVDPLVTWPTDEASPSGLLVTADAVYLAALRGQRLWRVPLDGDDGGRGGGVTVGSPQAAVDGVGRLRDVVAAPDGGLWLLTSNTARGDPGPDDDRLLRVPLG